MRTILRLAVIEILRLLTILFRLLSQISKERRCKVWIATCSPAFALRDYGWQVSSISDMPFPCPILGANLFGMCFGPISSFSSSIILGGVGIASINKVRSRNELPLACLPLFFGVQQLFEGLLWLVLQNPSCSSYQNPLTLSFLFFALFFWPIYTPLSFYLFEPKPERKRAMMAFVILGIFLGGYLLYSMTTGPFSASILYNSITYDKTIAGSELLINTAYLLSVFGAPLLASNRAIILITIINVILCAIAAHFYFMNFTSVWCFFAAIWSILFYLLFWLRSSGKERV